MASCCLLAILIVSLNYRLYANGCYTSIISFGDSLADTGSLKQLASISNKSYPSLHLPYGETFFHQPTGRCSNGRLIIDFLAESLGLPFIPPFTNHKGIDGFVELGQGVNYAVAGATALNTSFLQAKGIQNPITNASLGVELAWFQQSLPSLCRNTSDCKNVIGSSLILVGEIGGNDYNFPLVDEKSMAEIESYVPFVIDIIASTINDLIATGAQTLVVPGNLPVGCSPTYLSKRDFDKDEHDPTTGCLIRLNNFAEYHNQLLQIKLHQIREHHPDIVIIYADYFNAAMQFYRSPEKFGFTNGALKACCGGGGPYNYNSSMKCGYGTATVCDQPNTYANWDGVHLTEAAYKIIFKSLFQGSYTTPPFNFVCPTLASHVKTEFSSYM
ncbi:GDSL esterase/lipase At1g28600-like [Rutidosis leptorrhynchoides]|uniref:GDSL esterase/lipase At1g28600-like n=1 Tax=Rutidosis leptorrhynchoides TaxID=125765 RepID=UPI003A9A5265